MDAISQTTFSSAFSENVWITTKNSMKFVPKGPINNIPALVQIMAWCRPGDKPLSEPMMVSLLTHICVTRPQWVNQMIARRIAFEPLPKRIVIHFKSAYHQTSNKTAMMVSVLLFWTSFLTNSRVNAWITIKWSVIFHPRCQFSTQISCMATYQFAWVPIEFGIYDKTRIFSVWKIKKYTL